MSMSCGQGGDLGQVVGEDPLSGPGFRSFEVVQAGSVPAVSAFEGADPSFASGSPFDGSAESAAVLDLAAGGAGSALAGDDDRADPDVVIEHDTVVVVDDLGFVAELDGFTEPALRDRPGLLVVQTHYPAGPVRSGPGDPLAGLADD